MCAFYQTAHSPWTFIYVPRNDLCFFLEQLYLLSHEFQKVSEKELPGITHEKKTKQKNTTKASQAF